MSKYLFYIVLSVFVMFFVRNPPNVAGGQPAAHIEPPIDSPIKVNVVPAEQKLDKALTDFDKKIDKALDNLDKIEDNTQKAVKASKIAERKVKEAVANKEKIDTIIINLDTVVILDTLYFPGPTVQIFSPRIDNSTWWEWYVKNNDKMLRECTIHKWLKKQTKKIFKRKKHTEC